MSRPYGVLVLLTMCALVGGLVFWWTKDAPVDRCVSQRGAGEQSTNGEPVYGQDVPESGVSDGNSKQVGIDGEPADGSPELAAAERALLDRNIWDHPRESVLARNKYHAQVRRIIKPGYTFKTTVDRKAQRTIVIRAMGLCSEDISCAEDFLRWARHEDERVRRCAVDAFGRVARRKNEDDRRRLYKQLLDHLGRDLPLEAFALSLSIVGRFPQFRVSKKMLAAWKSRAVGDSRAARFVDETVRGIEANGGVVPMDSHGYPSGIFLGGHIFDPEDPEAAKRPVRRKKAAEPETDDSSDAPESEQKSTGPSDGTDRD